jgi:hypothetical protein
VLWACQNDDCTVFDRNNWLLGVVRREATSRTMDTTGRVVIKKFRLLCSSKCTDGTELLEVLITPNERNRELI